MGCMVSCLSGKKEAEDLAATRPVENEKRLSAKPPTSPLPGSLSLRRTTEKADDYGGPKDSIQWAVSPTSTQASDLTMVALDGDAEELKAKDEDIDDEKRQRAQKAEEARKKAEQEQEERDFLQWM